MKKRVLYLLFFLILCVFIPGQNPASNDQELGGTGTGFFITDNGIIITCNHVIDGAKSVNVWVGEQKYSAKILSKNKKNDLAVLSINYRNPSHFKISDFKNVKLGDKVSVLGFPLTGFGDILYTDGSVTGRSGYKLNPVQFQHSAPTHPGNSGGPIIKMPKEELNAEWEVIGIVVMGLDAVKLLINEGLVAPDANFGVKSEYLSPLLNNIKPGNGNIKDVDSAEEATVKIEVVLNKFYIYNKTGSALTSLEINAAGDPDWGKENLLRGKVFPTGSVVPFRLPDSANNLYDICFEYKSGIHQIKSDVLIIPNQTIELTFAIRGERGIDEKGDIKPILNIINKTNNPVLYVNVSPAKSTVWGDDRLNSNQALLNGKAFPVSIPDPGNYNIRLVDDKGNAYIKNNVTVNDDIKVEITNKDIYDKAPSGPPVNIVNNTENPVSSIYICPAFDNIWGKNRLTSNQLGKGQSVSLLLPLPLKETNLYNIMLVDTKGNTYTKKNVTVKDNIKIELSSANIDL